MMTCTRSKWRSIIKSAASGLFYCIYNQKFVPENRLSIWLSGRSTRVRSERHSVCVTDLADMQRPVIFGCAPHNSSLYVDTKLANETVDSNRKQSRSAAVSDPVARTMWSNIAVLYRCIQVFFWRYTASARSLISRDHWFPFVASNSN